MKNAILTLAVVFAAASAARAQIGAPVQAGGVEVDSDGTLKSQTTTADPRLAELWKNAKDNKKDSQLLYISLPRLLGEAKKAMQEGKPVPNQVKYLGGMVRLQYIFVYPAEKDLVIAGPAEPFDPDVFRPLGKITGRPVLQLDDLVVALRSCGPGKAGTAMGCDLQVTQEIADRIRKKTEEIAPKIESLGEKKAAQMIADAGGNQPVKFFGVDPGTRFAFVCIEADYRLKQLGLGILESPSKKVKSYNSMATKPEQAHRFALESNYEHLFVSPDGNAYELRGPSLVVRCGLMGVQGPEAEKVSDAAAKFSKQCSDNMEELCRQMLSWADVTNLADLAVLAALIGDLAKGLELDLSFAMDSKGYAVAPMTTPKSAKTLTTFRRSSMQTIFVSGGVAMDAAGAIQKKGKDEKVAGMAKRPIETWSEGKK